MKRNENHGDRNGHDKQAHVGGKLHGGGKKHEGHPARWLYMKTT